VTEPTSPGGDAATPTLLGEVAVWEAFRALRVEGVGLYPALTTYMAESGFFRPPGATLEVGSGDGALWRSGGGALLDALRAGPLHMTDTDEALIASRRAQPLFARPGVERTVADVEDLAFRGGAFQRVLATHVLHWCATPERVLRATRELARVLGRGGRALVVTVDEQVHMREVYALLHDARAALLARGVACPEEMPAAAPRVMPFCAGNARRFLDDAFARVQRVDLRYAHLVDDVHRTLGVRARISSSITCARCHS